MLIVGLVYPLMPPPSSVFCFRHQLDLECGKLQVQALGMVKAGRKDRALLLLKVKK